MYPKFSRIDETVEKEGAYRLDVVVSASGFTKQDSDKLEKVCIYLIRGSFY